MRMLTISGFATLHPKTLHPSAFFFFLMVKLSLQNTDMSLDLASPLIPHGKPHPADRIGFLVILHMKPWLSESVLQGCTPCYTM